MTDVASLKKAFKNKDLFDLALTHRSWVNEHKGVRNHNERLEFLGDAVLEYVVSKVLYEKFPEKEEGYLTALRSNLVNTVSLGTLAKELKLGAIIYLSKGEEEGGGRENTSLLADTVEAIIGAIFIDRGLADAEEFIDSSLLSDLKARASEPLKDNKSRLQELVQSKKLSAPRYGVVEESGPDHSKKFIIEVTVDGKTWGVGEGKSKSLAEQAAAGHALEENVE
ncbi:MAG TPA: ribonuclease III [Patescibacteria group bacterium]|nr:ribonuclease III [Patescibacteria group bacterium]